MGNSMGKKRKMAVSPSNKYKNPTHAVSLTSSSLNNLQVEFPKEIEEDLERRKIESLKNYAAGSRKPSVVRSTSAVVDPAHEMYEKVRKLDVPAVMVPKPWSEVDNLLSKMKETDAPKRTVSVPNPARSQSLEMPLETIDMWELMDDLNEEEDDASIPRKALNFDSPESPATPESFTPKKVEKLESSLSFSSIHTVKEVEGGATRPESVTSVLRALKRDSPRNPGNLPARTMSASAASTPRKVNINPNLLSRIELFS